MLGKHGRSWAGFAFVAAIAFSAFARAASVDLIVPDVPDDGGATHVGGFTETGAGTGDYYDETNGTVNNLIVFAQVQFNTMSPITADFVQEFGNSAGDGIIISNDPASIDLIGVDYFISDTYIPLDQLNFGTNPPSDGGTNSMWQPVPGLDGLKLGPGESTPLPAAMNGGLALLIAAGGIARLRRRAPAI